MKIIFLFFILLFQICQYSFSQSLAINTDGSTANASAMLDVKSNSKGLLIPRMTRAERDVIASPATGLLIFQNGPDSVGFYYYTGVKWTWLYSNANSDTLNWKTRGNTGTIDGQNFIGTTDNTPFNIRVNNQKAGLIDHLLYNTFFGFQTGNANTTGDQSTATGYQALYSQSTGGSNTAFGFQALYSNTTGNYNTGIGLQSLYNNTTGNNNTAIGQGSLFANTSGNYNTASGWFALRDNTGSGNTATGYNALAYNTTASNNTAFGSTALYINTTGAYNTAMGGAALSINTTGANNVAIGPSALITNTTGSNNTAIGYQADVSSGTLTNATAIGNGVIVNNSSKIRLGNASVTVIEGQVAYTFPSDGRFKTNISESDVKGLDFIKRLRPVVYNFDTKKFDEFLTKDMPSERRAKFNEKNYTLSSCIRQSGFIAQEVEKAAEESRYNFNGINKPVNDNDYYSLAYSQFVVPLVKGMQEQQQMIDKLKFQIDELKKQVEQLVKEKSK